ncbi:MAG: cytochrome P450 [Polyangiales bacterium]
MEPTTSRHAPSPPAHPVLGHLLPMRSEPLTWIPKVAREHGDVVRLSFPRREGVLINHPEGVRQVMQENHRNYDKSTPGFEELRKLLGNGLLTSEGDFWLRQRRIAQPAFSRQRLAGFAPAMVRAAEDLRERWVSVAPSRPTVDVADAMMALTLRIAGETLLSTDPSASASRVGSALAEILHQVRGRIATPFQFLARLPTARNKRYAEAQATLDRVVREIIEARRRGETRAASPDLLAMLMEARDEDGKGMSDEQLRDEVLTIFLAGHETTANALAWTFHLLSLHPGARRALHDELDAAVGDRAPTLDDLPQMPYARRVLQESMRLRPPVWFIARRAVGDDTVMGHRVKAGSMVFISPWALHRHPAYWPDPDGFDPDRFLPDAVAARPSSAYIPFGAGPRICIGQGFAMMEAQLILASLCRSVSLENLSGARVEPEPTVTLRPRGGLPMTLHPRR